MKKVTTKGQVMEILKDGDTLESLRCIVDGVYCSGEELPEQWYDSGFGGVEGESCICYSKRYIYIKVCYDGAEWFEAIPRNIKDVNPRKIPLLGGG